MPESIISDLCVSKVEENKATQLDDFAEIRTHGGLATGEVEHVDVALGRFRAMVAEGEDFENAVDMLGVMNARAELRELRGKKGVSEALIDAYIISGDAESLRQMALDGSDPENQARAIEAMGVVGGKDAGATLVQIYRDADSDTIREAALDGMLIADFDEGVLELYRSSTDPSEKKELLERLVIMDSDEVWSVIDSALEGGL